MAVRSEGVDVVVVTIQPGGPASVAGVLVGDILIAVANEHVSGKQRKVGFVLFSLTIADAADDRLTYADSICQMRASSCGSK